MPADPPAVELPTKAQAAPAAPGSTVRRVLEANGISTLVVIGAAIWVVNSVGDLKTAIAELKVRVGALEVDVKSVKTRLNVLSSGGKDDTGESFAPTPSAALPHSPVPSAQTAPSPVMTALPTSVRPTAPPVCVDKHNKQPMPCELAAQCWDRAAFNPNYWDKIRQSVGAEQMLLCDPQ